MTKTGLGGGIGGVPLNYVGQTTDVAQPKQTQAPAFGTSQYDSGTTPSLLTPDARQSSYQDYLLKMMTLEHPTLTFSIPQLESSLQQLYSQYTSEDSSLQDASDPNPSSDLADELQSRTTQAWLTNTRGAASAQNQTAMPSAADIQDFLSSLPPDQLNSLYQQYMVQQYPPGQTTAPAATSPAPTVTSAADASPPPQAAAVVAQPDSDAQNAVSQGSSLFNAGNYNQAFSQFKLAITLDSTLLQSMPQLNYYLGVSAAYSTPPDNDAAANYYQQFLNSPTADATTKSWVQNQLQHGMPAQQEFQDAMMLFNGHDPSDAQSVKAYQDALKIDPGMAKTLYLSNNTQNYDAALQKFQDALKTDPSMAKSNPAIFYYLGVAAEYSSNPDPALVKKYYQQYLSAPQSDPGTTKWVTDEMSWLKVKDAASAKVQEAQDDFYTNNEPLAALKTLQDAVAEYPLLKTKNSGVLFSLAQYAFYAGDTKLAQKYMREAKPALEEWQKGLKQSHDAMEQNLPGSPGYLQNEQNYLYYQSMVQQFNDMQGQLSGAAGIGHLSNWLTQALGGGKLGNTLASGFLNMWIGAGQFGQARGKEHKEQMEESQRYNPEYDLLGMLHEIRDGDIVGSEFKSEAEYHKRLADQKAEKAALAEFLKANKGVDLKKYDQHAEDLAQTPVDAMILPPDLLRRVEQIFNRDQRRAEPNPDDPAFKLRAKEIEYVKASKQKEISELKAKISLLDAGNVLQRQASRFERHSLDVELKKKEQELKSYEASTSTFSERREKLVADRARALQDVEDARALAAEFTTNPIKKSEQNKTLEARERELDDVDNELNQLTNEASYNANMRDLLAHMRSYNDTDKEAKALQKKIDAQGQTPSTEDKERLQELQEQLANTKRDIQALQNRSTRLSTSRNVTALTDTYLGPDGGKRIKTVAIDRTGQVHETGQAFDESGNRYDDTRVAGTSLTRVKEIAGGGEVTTRVGVGLNEAGENEYGPGWWGLGTTMAHAQSVQKTWTMQKNLDDLGLGNSSLTATANAGNAEARTFNMVYGGSTGSGIGVGGMIGAQARADAVDANYDLSHQGGKTTIGGVTINNLVSQDMNAQASVGASAGAEVGLGAGQKGFDASMNVGAFAGAQYGGMVGSTVDGVGMNVMGQAWDGVGFKFDPSARLDKGKLKLHVGLGAGLGVGGYEGVNYTLDFNQIGRELQGIFTDPKGLWCLARDTVGGYGGVDTLEDKHNATIQQFQTYAAQADKSGDKKTAQEMRDYVAYLQHDPYYTAQKDATYAKGAVALLRTPTAIRRFAALNKLVYQAGAKVARAVGQGASKLADVTGLSDTALAKSLSKVAESARGAVESASASLGRVAESIGETAAKAMETAKAAISSVGTAIRDSALAEKLAAGAAKVASSISEVAGPLAKGVTAGLELLGKGASAAFEAVSAVAKGASTALDAIPFVGEIVTALIVGVTSEVEDKQKLDAARKRRDFDQSTINSLNASQKVIASNLAKCADTSKTLTTNRKTLQSQVSMLKKHRQDLLATINAHPNDPTINSPQNRTAVEQLNTALKKLSDADTQYAASQKQITDAIKKLTESSKQIPLAIKKLNDDMNDQNDTIDEMKKVMGADWFLGAGTSGVGAYKDTKKLYSQASDLVHSSNAGKKILGGLEYAGAGLATALDWCGRTAKTIFVPCA